jgi:hypothetical protein
MAMAFMQFSIATSTAGVLEPLVYLACIVFGTHRQKDGFSRSYLRRIDVSHASHLS